MRQFVRALSDRTSNGSLSKASYLIDGVPCLVKGCSEGTCEPFSEVLGSRIFKRLVEYPVLEYSLDDFGYYIGDIETYGFEYVSVSKELQYHIFNFYSYLEGLTLRGKIKVTESNALQHYINLGLDLKYLYQMLVVDALIGNDDRHWNNIDLCVTEDGSLSLAPMLDFGRSLLYNKSESELNKIGSVGPDKSKPIKDLHSKQIQFLKQRFGVYKFIKCNIHEFEIFLNEECSDIFNLMSKRRIETIKLYLLNRYKEYIQQFEV